MSRTTRLLPCALALVLAGSPLVPASAAPGTRGPLERAATERSTWTAGAGADLPAAAVGTEGAATAVTGAEVSAAAAAAGARATATPVARAELTPAKPSHSPAPQERSSAEQEPSSAGQEPSHAPQEPSPAPTATATPTPTTPTPTTPTPTPTTPTPTTPVPASPTTPVPASPKPSPYYGKDASWDANEPQRRVAVYGDSLVMQSKPLLHALAGTRATALDVWELPGAAPCDLLPQYGGRMKAFRTQRVQLAFVGNATSPCMTSRIGGRPPGVLTAAKRQQIANLYAADVAALVRWNRAAGVLTYLVLPPAMADRTWHGQLTGPLTTALTRIATQQPGHVRLNTAARDTLTPGGVYQPTTVLNGRRVQLRHRDGTHLFAPTGTTAYAQALLWPLALEP